MYHSRYILAVYYSIIEVLKYINIINFKVVWQVHNVSLLVLDSLDVYNMILDFFLSSNCLLYLRSCARLPLDMMATFYECSVNSFWSSFFFCVSAWCVFSVLYVSTSTLHIHSAFHILIQSIVPRRWVPLSGLSLIGIDSYEGVLYVERF